MYEFKGLTASVFSSFVFFSLIVSNTIILLLATEYSVLD